MTQMRTYIELPKGAEKINVRDLPAMIAEAWAELSMSSQTKIKEIRKLSFTFQIPEYEAILKAPKLSPLELKILTAHAKEANLPVPQDDMTVADFQILKSGLNLKALGWMPVFIPNDHAGKYEKRNRQEKMYEVQFAEDIREGRLKARDSLSMLILKSKASDEDIYNAVISRKSLQAYLPDAVRVHLKDDDGDLEPAEQASNNSQYTGEDAKFYLQHFNDLKPKIRIHVLALKAVIELQQKTPGKVQPKAVIELLQKWAQEGRDPLLPDKVVNGVKWQTTVLTRPDFNEQACRKKLQRWYEELDIMRTAKGH